MVKLTFAIPTYNRPKQLERLLMQIKPQLNIWVEVLIRDDSETDESEALARKILKGKNLRYFRGKKEGIDYANIFLAKEAKGEFVWWCGDDEEVLPGAIERILNVINTYPNLSFIFLNFLTHGNFAPGVQRPDGLINKNDFLREVGVNMTLLSSGVWRRTNGQHGIPLGEKYLGTHFASQPVILEALTRGDIYILSGCLINHPTPLVKGEGLFWDGVKTMGITDFNLMQEFKHRFDKGAVRSFLKRNFGHIWRGLIIDWIRRDIPAPRNRLWELRIYRFFPEYWLAVLIYLLPKRAVALLLRIYKVFVKKHYRQP